MQGLLQDHAYSVTYLGAEDHSGVSVHHFAAVRTPQGEGDSGTITLLLQLSRMDIYVDAASLLPVSLAFSIHPDNNALQDIPVSIEFSGYRNVSGVMTPFRVQKFLQRSLLLDISIARAAVNPGLPANEFEIQ